MFFQDGWVQTAIHVKIEDVFLMRSMWPSYRTSSHAHKLWVAVESNGNSLAGHCNCMAGEVNKPTDLWHHIA